MDIAIIFIMGILLSGVMKTHGTWKPLGGIGDIIAWCLVCIFLLALVRIPFYLTILGPHIPFNASEWLQFMSGVLAIVFWYAMLYWRIPMRLMGRLKNKS